MGLSAVFSLMQIRRYFEISTPSEPSTSKHEGAQTEPQNESLPPEQTEGIYSNFSIISPHNKSIQQGGPGRISPFLSYAPVYRFSRDLDPYAITTALVIKGIQYLLAIKVGKTFWKILEMTSNGHFKKDVVGIS
ncbi:hypothetical protein TNCT_335301 [Trichonephila clavata]|uniref:Uncharacterized protein n=1 Tax=Trichonephila clavata TaxID=2740835 RepID=A0A8X6GTE0_TRICU|nr:hypothetical protein TNCT_335301 [Trichonephila clavata]